MLRVVFLSLLLLFCNGAFSKNLTPPPLEIKTGWKFCPVENYQIDINVSTIKCYPIELPIAWESIVPDYDGYGILYTEFELPQQYSKIPLAIFMDRVRDADKTFINNIPVGETGNFPPEFDKAVLYSRLYEIPHESLKFGEKNQLKLWIYNDARPGGLTQSIPIIDSHAKLLAAFYQDNYQALIFIVILTIFGLLHFIYFIFNQEAEENFFYSLFLFCWSLYLYTYSNIPLSSGLSMNLLFRSNVALFFTIFSLLPLFIYKFFQQPLSRVLKVIVSISLLFVPVCFILPEPGLLYYPLEFVQLLTIPALISVYWLLFRAVKAKLAYARPITLVMILYTCLGSFDIMLDFIQPDKLNHLSLYGPWALLVLTIVLTLIVAHKNLSYYKDATIDRLTGTLRFNEFKERLEQETFRADRENKILTIVMLDLDNFKLINDNYGHIQGDRVLTLVSTVLHKELRHFDLLARYGGDEFCIAATLEDPQKARDFVERLHSQLNQLEFNFNGKIERITSTMGAIARTVGDFRSSEILIEQADNLLIQAKFNHKGRVLW